MDKHQIMGAVGWALNAQLCLTLCDPMNCSLPESSTHGISQARILEWVAIPFSRDLPKPEFKPASLALAGRFFTTEPPGYQPYKVYIPSKYLLIQSALFPDDLVVRIFSEGQNTPNLEWRGENWKGSITFLLLTRLA